MRLLEFLARLVPHTKREATISGGARCPVFSPLSILRARRRVQRPSRTIVPAGVLSQWRSDNAEGWCWRQQSYCEIANAGCGVTPLRTPLLHGPDPLLRLQTGEHGVAPKNPPSRLVINPAFEKPGRGLESDRDSPPVPEPPRRGERHRDRRRRVAERHHRGCGK